MSSTGHTRSHTGTIHQQRTRGQPLHTMRAAGLFLYAQHSKTEPPHQARQAGPDMDHTQRPRHTRGAAPAAGPGKPRQVTTRAPSRRTNTAEKRKRKKNTNAVHHAKENKKFSRVLSSLIFPCGACEPKNLLDS